MKLFRLCLLTTTLLSLIACSEPEQQVKEEPIRPVKLFTIGHDSQINIRSFPAEVVANQGSYLVGCRASTLVLPEILTYQ